MAFSFVNAMVDYEKTFVNAGVNFCVLRGIIAGVSGSCLAVNVMVDIRK